jgi:hypothetical protein
VTLLKPDRDEHRRSIRIVHWLTPALAVAHRRFWLGSETRLACQVYDLNDPKLFAFIRVHSRFGFLSGYIRGSIFCSR